MRTAMAAFAQPCPCGFIIGTLAAFINASACCHLKAKLLATASRDMLSNPRLTALVFHTRGDPCEI
jgi:hypothetical protein